MGMGAGTRMGTQRVGVVVRGFLLASALLAGACSHASQESRLLGYWEGTLPAPATGQPLPISYDFRPDGLTVTVGLGPNRTVTHWPHWEVSGEDHGDLVVQIVREDQRVFATLARPLDHDQLMLWDIGTEESTAARVRRVQRPPGLEAEHATGEGSGQAP
jgi:hypothetical protein